LKNVTLKKASLTSLSTGTVERNDRMRGDASTREGKEHRLKTR